MPNLNTPLHLDMYKTGVDSRRFNMRLKHAMKILFNVNNPYVIIMENC